MDKKKGCSSTVLMQKYELGRLLGQGAFAKVYHARRVATGEAYAIKVLHKDMVLRGGPAMTEQIKREISVMRRVRHPNIVRLHEVMATKSKIYFAMEYVDGGELFSRVSLGRLGEDDARRYFQQLVAAVDFCHSRGVYHRDLKLENLLLDRNSNLKVTDFGLSALGDSCRTDELLHTACGTPAYVAPEVLSRRGYDGAKADIWSCGVILYVLLAGFLPFNDSNLVVLYQKIMKGEFKCPPWFPPQVKTLLARILDPSPNSRITISAILSYPWVRRGFKQPAAAAEPQQLAETEHEVTKAFGSSTTTSGGSDKDLKCMSLNAFDIISRAPGFDLSGLFERDRGHKRPQEHLQASFTSKKSATEIVSKLEEIATLERGFKVRKTDGRVKLQGYKEGRKGQIAIDAEIFRVAPDFHMVEMKKSAGDTWECHNFYNQELKPKLKDIVWTWQLGGDHQQGQHSSPSSSSSSSPSQEADTKPLLSPQPRSA